jgi:hypothetical protein
MDSGTVFCESDPNDELDVGCVEGLTSADSSSMEKIVCDV